MIRSILFSQSSHCRLRKILIANIFAKEQYKNIMGFFLWWYT